MNILLVEDYDALRAVTAEVLTAHGHQVHALPSAEALDELPLRQPFDLAVLDLNLPGEDGLSLANRLRAACPRIGIVMVTVRHSLPDKLAGYAHGADLYLPKPTAPEELCAAVQALGRRLGLVKDAEAVPIGPTFKLQVQAALLQTPAGTVLLRHTEVLLLHALVLAPQGTLEYWQILQLLKKPMDEAGKAQLEVLVSRLRQKLQTIGLPDPLIKAERGKGYRLCAPVRLA